MSVASGTAPSAPRPALAGSSGHNLALDGVRGMAILLVMWHHMTVFHPSNAAEHLFESVAQLGTTGVDLFFVLSGFLITGILYDSKQSLTARGQGEGAFFGNFYARRTLRIFPLYYAVVFGSLIVLPHAGELLRQFVDASRAAYIETKLQSFQGAKGYAAWFWLYLSNFPIGWTGRWLHQVLGISWSLAIEEQFYLVWPMLVWFLSRRAAIRVCAGLVVLALICRCVLVGIMLKAGVGYGTPPADGQYLPLANPIGVYVLSFCRVDDLAFGALGALLLRGSVDVPRAAGIARKLVLLCGGAAIALIVIDNLMGWAIRENLGTGGGPLFQTIGYTLAGLTCLGALILAIASNPGGLWHRFWTSRFMRTLGKYAYALYLFHLPIRAVIRDAVFGPAADAGKAGPRWTFGHILGSEFPGQLAFYAICIAASLAAAWVSWIVFESQILKLKKFFPSGVEGGDRAPKAAK
jgi:peptidoglycan/LPS O-acetylase OafA/YrhL